MFDIDREMKIVISHLNNCYNMIRVLALSSYPAFHELADLIFLSRSFLTVKWRRRSPTIELLVCLFVSKRLTNIGHY